MLHINIPSFSYQEELVLENIDKTFETAKTHGIVGLNGAGKTTFFKLLSGYLKQKNIKINLNNKPIEKQDIAFIDSDLFFYKKITAREFLSVFPCRSNTYNEEKMAELFHLSLDHFTEEYSTGMKKKLILLSQIKQDKNIYILDEPFNGLDLETNKILEVIIKILNERGKTIFISSHILDPLLHVCENIHYIKDKTIFKTYQKNEFNELEKDLFGNYSNQLQQELKQLI